MGLAPKDVLERVKTQCPTAEVVDVPGGDSFAVVPADKFLELCRWVKTAPELEFDYCASVGGYDDLTNLWSVLHLYSIKRNHRLVLKVKLDRQAPSVSSVCELWPGANWHERESYDMY